MIQQGAGWIVRVLIWSSLAGLVLQAAMAFGLPMRSGNWGPGATAEAIQLSDGRYAVLLPSLGRIQIYSSSLQFLYGWNTERLSGPTSARRRPVLRLSADGNLNFYRHLAYSRPGWVLRSFDANGTFLLQALIKADDYDPAKLPGRGGQLIQIPDGSQWWWTFPFRGLFWALGTLFGTVFVWVPLSFVLFTREEREACSRW
jgi:hypothetical protein